MKNILLALLVIASFAACSKPIAPVEKSAESIKITIDSILTLWHADAATADASGYFGSMDSASIYLGTDATENWDKVEFAIFCQPYFKKGKVWEFTAFERNIYLSQDGKVAWFDELLDTWMGTCRGSGVLEMRGKDWKIKHYVLSVMIPNKDIDAVVSLKQASDSLFRAEYGTLDE